MDVGNALTLFFFAQTGRGNLLHTTFVFFFYVKTRKKKTNLKANVLFLCVCEAVFPLKSIIKTKIVVLLKEMEPINATNGRQHMDLSVPFCFVSHV